MTRPLNTNHSITVMGVHLAYRSAMNRFARSTSAAGSPAYMCLNSPSSMKVWSQLKPMTRGLHSFNSQLNLGALYGIGGARRGSVARVKGVLGGVYGC